MIEDLKEVRMDLNNIANYYAELSGKSEAIRNFHTMAEVAIAKLDAVITRLESHEQANIDRQNCTACHDSTPYTHGYICDKHRTSSGRTNTIKGKDNEQNH